MVASSEGPITRNWKAWDDGATAPATRVQVTGEVHAAHPAAEAKLAPLDPQGINNKILLLEVTLSSPEDERAEPTWKPARCAVPIAEGAEPFDQVVVFYRDRIVADIGIVHA